MISPTAEYALRAIVAIAQSSGGAVVTPTIAEITRVPPGYLPRFCRLCVGRGWCIPNAGWAEGSPWPDQRRS